MLEEWKKDVSEDCFNQCIEKEIGKNIVSEALSNPYPSFINNWLINFIIKVYKQYLFAS